MRMSSRRGKLVDRFASEGRMLAISCTEERLAEICESLEGMGISAYNSPRLFSVGGTPEKIDRLKCLLDEHRIAYVAMPMPYAFHTELIEPCRSYFGEVLTGLQCKEPAIPFASTVTGKMETSLDAEYWWNNLRQPVQFSQAISAAVREGINTFIEISPSPTLVKQVQESSRTIPGADVAVIPSVSVGEEVSAYLVAAGRLWSLGALVDIGRIVKRCSDRVPLPKYPWLRKYLWHETFEVAQYRQEKLASLLLGRRVPGHRKGWLSTIDIHKFPLLLEHTFRGAPLFPASGFLDMAYGACRAITDQDCCALENLEIVNGLFLNNTQTVVQFLTEYHKETNKIEVYSRVAGDEKSWRKNCHSRIATLHGITGAREWARALAIMADDVGRFPGEMSYRLSFISQLHYGPSFRLLDRGWALRDEVVARVKTPEGEASDGYFLHPAILDACFQPGNMNHRYHFGMASTQYTFVPIKLGRLEVLAPFIAKEFIVYFYKKMTTIKYSIGDIFIFDEAGSLLVHIEDFEAFGIDLTGDRSNKTFGEFVYQMSWLPVLDDVGDTTSLSEGGKS